MVRRKKSLLFSVSLASAGLVAGALFLAAPKTQAASEELEGSSSEAKIQAISEETDIPESVIESSVKTRKLIIEIKDEKELKNNPDVVEYKKVAEDVYIVTFKSSEATSENYQYYKDNKAENIDLNLPMKIQGYSDGNIPQITHPKGSDGTVHDPGTEFIEPFRTQYNSCVNDTDKVHRNFTGYIDNCLAWGTKSTGLYTYSTSITSAKNVNVAVIDTGIRASQYAFNYNSATAQDRLNMTYAYDYIGKDTNPSDSANSVDSESGDRVTHGTTVAATITESTPYNVKIVPIRVAKAMDMNLADVVDAIADLKGKDVKVINLSLGSVDEVTESDLINDDGFKASEKILKEAKADGKILVAATGNDGNDKGYISWPAMSQYTIAVGSIDNNEEISSFSQYTSTQKVDFVAPGEMLILPDGLADNSASYAFGTSFATPYVSAAIATILSEHPTYNQDQVYAFLKMNVKDLGATGRDNIYGWGSIEFKAASINITPETQTDPVWAKDSVDLTINAKNTASVNITQYAILKGDKAYEIPSSWKNIDDDKQDIEVDITESFEENGTYTIWVKDVNGKTQAKVFEVKSIDKTAPTVKTGLKVSEITDTSAKLSIEVKDAASGLDKIIWNYKLEDAEEFTQVPGEDFSGETTEITRTHELSELETGKTYKVFATITDKAGNQKTSEVATFTAVNGASDVQTKGDVEETPVKPSMPSSKPKTVKTRAGVKNPKTADINVSAIAGAGVALSAVAFFIFRAKRR